MNNPFENEKTEDEILEEMLLAEEEVEIEEEVEEIDEVDSDDDEEEEKVVDMVLPTLESLIEVFGNDVGKEVEFGRYCSKFANDNGLYFLGFSTKSGDPLFQERM